MPPKISSQLRKQLSAIATPIHKAKGELLFRSGEAGKGAFLIRAGQVRLTLAAGPRCYPSRLLGVGAVVGLPATFSGEPYSLTAEAAKDCRLDFIPRSKLLKLLQNNPLVGFQVVRILSEEIFQMRRTAKLNEAQHQAVN
jgi:CRP-like cAMP-binding protein